VAETPTQGVHVSDCIGALPYL